MAFDPSLIDSDGLADALRETVEHQEQAAQIPLNVDAGLAPEIEKPDLNLPETITLPEGDPELQKMLQPLVDGLNQTIAAVQELAGGSAAEKIAETLKQQHEQLVGLTQFLLTRQELPVPAPPDDDFGLREGMEGIGDDLDRIGPYGLTGSGIDIINSPMGIGLGAQTDPFADDGGVLAREVQWAKVKQDWTGDDDNVVYGYPCSDINGADVDTDTTLTLYAVTKHGDYVDYVYAKEDDIVAYLPFELAGVTSGVLVNVIHGGKYYNQTALQWTQDYGVKQDSWLRTNDSTSWGSIMTVTTRIVAVGGTPTTFYGYKRYIYLDHAGQVRNISPEDEYTIIVM